MSDSIPTADEELHPEIRPGRRFNKVWIIPIVAVLLGVWLVKQNYDNKGSLITIRFENADGIKENKTELKCRNVSIGMVEEIDLTDDLEVDVKVRVKPQHLHLIREDSRFWVEKPRIQGASVSGLNTLLSGAFLQLDPGLGQTGARNFTGLETPPITPASIEGLRLTLTAEEPGSVNIGTGIYYHETLIGRVESKVFDLENRVVNLGIFVEKKFAPLITDNSLFWRSSGINLEVGVDGFKLDLPSLDALVAGRISVDVPSGLPPGDPMPDGMVHALFNSQEEAQSTTFQGGAEFLVLIDESLRGLKVGSPVEFRGLRVGRVGQISYKLIEEIEINQMPVLVQLDDRLMATHFPPSLLDGGQEGIEDAVKNGLRASLKSTNLLTGQLFVDLDYFPNEPQAALEKEGDLLILPTIHTGFANLQDQVVLLLEKLNDLEIEGLVTKLGQATDEATETLAGINKAVNADDGVIVNANKTLKEISTAVTSLNAILADEETKALPAELKKTLAQVQKSLEPLSAKGAVYGDLRRTMDELRAAVRSIDRLTTEIADKPNSLIFGKNPNTKKVPRARR